MWTTSQHVFLAKDILLCLSPEEKPSQQDGESGRQIRQRGPGAAGGKRPLRLPLGWRLRPLLVAPVVHDADIVVRIVCLSILLSLSQPRRPIFVVSFFVALLFLVLPDGFFLFFFVVVVLVVSAAAALVVVAVVLSLAAAVLVVRVGVGTAAEAAAFLLVVSAAVLVTMRGISWKGSLLA